MILRALCILALGLAAISAPAQLLTLEQRHQIQISKFLTEFNQDSVKKMNQLPAKLTPDGFIKTTQASRFSSVEIDTKKFVELKDQMRQEFCPKSSNGEACLNQKSKRSFAGIDRNNSPLTLLENSRYVNVYQLDVREGRTAVQPWSDYYWATYRAGVAYRYADSQFPAFAGADGWPQVREFFNVNLNTPINSSSELNRLSPAEKYDLLVGDINKGLTRSQINNAENTYNSFGRIETWFGICHGWAAAAFMHQRPLNKVSVTLPNRMNLDFYPSDIKALSSLAWANSRRAPQLFAGGRCDVKNPQQDQNGRTIDPNCWDANPALWHATVVNRVGLDKKSFVFDVTYDYEVWNQPVVAYRMSYFNPANSQASSNIRDVMTYLPQMTNDKFRAYRSPSAQWVVGVIMDVDYAVETAPNQNSSDSSYNDGISTVQFVYDLEIDEKGNIVGGEWYQNAHPDFVWTPQQGSQPLAGNESFNLYWDGRAPLNSQAQSEALSASRSGSPLNAIVIRLLQMAQ